ncbi:dihydroneopterin aldolase [Desulforamulus reducens MI-1]|uniref:7,8-dihydroneopterin aldolase n=1 Tax=Desulforamulus reducens (strain ATCC BAA-1160 / DSM 100696 / MI-1) TaxID=349161 RepID=A4J0V1_DESRM|nr:dihydroneopterin aldolase [Desulforamulus reducens MI-1]
MMPYYGGLTVKDKIILRGMNFFGYHGVFEEERRLGQPFQVDLELSMDLQPAGQGDDLNLSVSYAEVFEIVEQVLTGEPYKLLEAVAERISQRVLEQYEKVEEIKVTLKKPNAPIQGNFQYMAVEITRGRKH